MIALPNDVLLQQQHYRSNVGRRTSDSLLADLSICTPLNKLHDAPLHCQTPDTLAPGVEWNHQQHDATRNPCHRPECGTVTGPRDPWIGVEGKQETECSC